MKIKKIIILTVAILTIIAIVICIVAAQSNRRIKIDEWSGSLVADKIESAVISKNYGASTLRYTLTADEYDELIALSSGITEKNFLKKNALKKLNLDASDTECHLALYYDGTLWLFKCYDGGVVELMFESAEIAEHYGYNGALYFDVPDLWDYIMDKAENQAE